MKKLLSVFLAGIVFLLLPSLARAQQDGTITGTVLDAETGESLPGANVQVVGLDLGEATNAQGEFAISGVPAGEQVLRVSFVGYEEVEQEVNVPAGGTAQVDVSISPQTGTLEEVVVVGYGEQEREELTGTVTSIDAQEIEDIGSIGSPEQLLQGTAGVQVTTTSGLAGQAVNVSVRGVSTLNGNSQPLYVVDGTPITNTSTGSGFGQATNSLSQLNPQEIQSIEVLKGAAATAIYGSRAANGVVLIQTKKGSSTGETSVTASYQLGAVQSTSEYEEKIVDGPKWAELHQEAVRGFYQNCDITAAGGLLCKPLNGGLSFEQIESTLQAPYESAVLGLPEVPAPEDAPSYDWLGEAKRTGIAHQANFSVQGGDENTQYFISGTFQKDESYVKSNRFNRFSGRMNLSQDAADWLQVGTNTAITRTENFQAASDNLVAGVLTSSALMPPVVPIRNDDGTYNFNNPWNIADNVIGSSEINSKNIRNWRILSTSFIEAQPFESLSLRAEGGIDALIVDDFTRYDRRTTDGAPDGFGAQVYEDERRYSLRGTATYDNTFLERHDLNLVVGTSFEDSRRNDVAASATAFPSSAFRNVDSGASPSTTDADVSRKEGLASFFGRATYTLDNKYILQGSLRWDGSSRFGENTKWGRFGSGSFAYRLAQEDFMQRFGWLSNLKLRGSLGWVGNKNIGGFFPQLTLAAGGADYNQAPGLAVNQLGNPNLQWESVRNAEAGIDLGLFNDRIFLTTAYFRNLTTNLITNRQLPYTSGFNNVTQNRGELLSEGIEGELETQNFTGNFKWSTSINVTYKRNKVQDLPGDEPIISGMQRAVEGEELSFYMHEYLGVDPQTGQPLFRGVDGGEVNDPSSEARSLQGGILPNWTGGFTNTFNYKGFDLRASFTFEAGHKVYNDTKRFLMLYATFGLHEDALNRWQEPGDQTDVPRATYGDAIDNSTRTSTRFLEDGSYLRFRNLTFGYTLPGNLTQRFGVNRLRLYFQGSNLWTYEKLSIGDPEGSTGGQQDVLDRGELFFTPPQQRTFTGGLQLQF